MPRKSFWAWGMEADEPTEAQRRELAAALSAKYGVSIDVPPVPSSADLDCARPA